MSIKSMHQGEAAVFIVSSTLAYGMLRLSCLELSPLSYGLALSFVPVVRGIGDLYDTKKIMLLVFYS